MSIISICNQKGGVGKTTVAYHLGWGLYELGHSVLLIDLDPQGNLSITFGKDTCNTLEIFTDKPVLKSELVLGNDEYTGISLITSDLRLAKAEARTSYDSYMKLKKALPHKKHEWDYIIIDCPPSLGLFTINAFIASHYLLIPTLPFYYSLVGLRGLMEVAEGVKEEGMNPNLKVLGILINQIDRTVVSREAIAVLSENFPSLVFDTKIPKTIRVEEGLQNKKPVWEYDAESPASIAFKDFIEEFLKKEEML